MALRHVRGPLAAGCAAVAHACLIERARRWPSPVVEGHVAERTVLTCSRRLHNRVSASAAVVHVVKRGRERNSDSLRPPASLRGQLATIQWAFRRACRAICAPRSSPRRVALPCRPHPWAECRTHGVHATGLFWTCCSTQALCTTAYPRPGQRTGACLPARVPCWLALHFPSISIAVGPWQISRPDCVPPWRSVSDSLMDREPSGQKR